MSQVSLLQQPLKVLPKSPEPKRTAPGHKGSPVLKSSGPCRWHGNAQWRLPQCPQMPPCPLSLAPRPLSLATVLASRPLFLLPVLGREGLGVSQPEPRRARSPAPPRAAPLVAPPAASQGQLHFSSPAARKPASSRFLRLPAPSRAAAPPSRARRRRGDRAPPPPPGPSGPAGEDARAVLGKTPIRSRRP